MADTSLTPADVLAVFQTGAAITANDFFLVQGSAASQAGSVRALRIPVNVIKGYLTTGVYNAVMAVITGQIGGDFAVASTEETEAAMAEVFGTSSSSSS